MKLEIAWAIPASYEWKIETNSSAAKGVISNINFQTVQIYLTLSGLNLPLSSSSTTSRELLSQFSTCSGWRWFEVDGKFKKITMY